MEKQNSSGRIRMLFIGLILIALFSCSKKTSPPDDSYYINNGFQKAIIYNPGIAGCNLVLKIDSLTYEPLNLSTEFSIPDKQVWIKFHKEKNSMSSCMMGSIVTIDDIYWIK